MTHPKRHYSNKVVLVTGAGGSIGSEICRRLIAFEVSKIVMVARSEIDLFKIERELREKAPAGALVTVLASITDQAAMERAITEYRPDMIVHAAAHKHVPLCEQNPVEAVMNNVGGTMTLVHTAARLGVEQFVMVSSDKAVKPASVMGATKRVCELFLRFFAPRTAMKITTVRFGNVLDSSGSVLPIWREQLRQGKPITLTDKRCTRFFMSIPEAADLTLSAAALARPDGLFVLDMGKPRELLWMAYEIAGLQEGDDCTGKIEFTGLRPGEKLTEELSYGGELVTTMYPKVMRVRENEAGRITRWADFEDLLMAAKCNCNGIMLEKLWEIVR